MKACGVPKTEDLEKKMADISISQENIVMVQLEIHLRLTLRAAVIKRSLGRKPAPDGALERQKSRPRTPGGTQKPTAVKKTALPPTPGAAPRILARASAPRPSTLRASASKKTA
ncbi:hypothetical protein EYC80_007021 [Monilinia laxa]|uniref:Uncharacterized protein n=1 Tax=Monilinia laxa TaxID=61186 RepID=A0A5N6K0C2_MONLA|nr:hypothetical protein EYC80_007021 [Monilinia laxa]